MSLVSITPRLFCCFAIICFAATAVAAEAKTEKDHPLWSEIESGKKRVEQIENSLKGYTCKFTKRERVGGELLDHEIMQLKVRHEPFSVYMKFVAPDGVKGQQALFIKGKNDDSLQALPVGLAGKLGVYTLDPTGFLAMQGQRYPITETGMLNLAHRLIEVGKKELKNPETKVRKYKGAKVDGRVCTVTEVINPNKRADLRYHKAQIFVDDELNLPVRFVSYDWPEEEGGEPLLLEEYTYSNIEMNPGLDDDDFVIEQ